MVVASISFRVQPHKRPETLTIVDETIERMRGTAGCSRVRLYADGEDPNTFTMLSEWESADEVNAFVSSRAFQSFRGIRMLLRGDPLIVVDEVQTRITRLFR
jgi:quinol monooxygenase YgiN